MCATYPTIARLCLNAGKRPLAAAVVAAAAVRWVARGCECVVVELSYYGYYYLNGYGSIMDFYPATHSGRINKLEAVRGGAHLIYCQYVANFVTRISTIC